MRLNQIAKFNQIAVNNSKQFDGIASFLLRLYLSPVLIQAGWTKMVNFDQTVEWFGGTEFGLGLPLPEIMVLLATSAELVGGVLILVGLFTRIACIPLMITMLVAALSTHIKNGWLAIADSNSWLADGTIFYNQSVMEAAEKKEMAISILQQYGHYDWLTSSGSFVILNNGIEFSITYLIMLLALFFLGGGRYVSFDYYLTRRFLNT